MRAVLLIAILLAGGGGKFNKVLAPGDAAPAWANLPGIDDKKHSLADHKDRDVVVLIFTCNSCAASVEYEDRIISLTKKYGENKGRVAVVAVNVNTIPADRLDKMQERAKARGFNFPYLYDESQKIAKDYGATYTPEFFVLNRDRKLVYTGAMDDKGPPGTPSRKFVEEAIDAALAGKSPEVTETLPRGCMIRYARAKR